MAGSSCIYWLLIAGRMYGSPWGVQQLGLQTELGSSQAWRQLGEPGESRGQQLLRLTDFKITGEALVDLRNVSWRKACRSPDRHSPPQYTDKKSQILGGQGGYTRSLLVAKQPLEPRLPGFCLSRASFTSPSFSLILKHCPIHPLRLKMPLVLSVSATVWQISYYLKAAEPSAN